ncbi:unnamed protein product [Chironomus riparius]|uniref:Carboxylic ester hydrolase n=1 Tax=Chironomus riparius TaxID=315576 RepID=A0A9N9S6W7_9DIPT|nr:unnamed protein product [Chironomus riparius]
MKCNILSGLIILGYISSIRCKIVQIEDGKLEGTLMKTRKGFDVYAFLKIPFAEPPVGKLRFQPPVPKKKWNEILNATEFGPACMQNANGLTVSEDCLHLNVFTKDLDPAELKPVIVYIHYGAFVTGSSVFGCHPGYLLDRDVMLVTINYRLGPFGFLATGTKDAYGNMGLKDQSLALKWIKKNIDKFGGDPDQVTITGLSAGGFSVTSHIASEMSKGLFKRAIALSGAITWQTGLDRNNIDKAKQMALRLNCPINLNVLVKCLKTKSAIEIVQVSVDGYFGCLSMPWVPVVEPDLGQERFFTDDPNKLLKTGKFNRVPVMIGVTADDFISPVASLLNNEESLDLLNNNFSEIASKCFFFKGNGIRTTEEIAKIFKNHYLPYDKIDQTAFNSLSQLSADGIIGYAVHRFAHYAAQFTDVYYYKFTYMGERSNFHYPRNKPYVAHHGDDINYILSSNYPPAIKESDPDNFMVERLTRIWEQFAKYGNPNNKTDEVLADLNWPKLDTVDEYFLDNGKNMVEKRGLYLERYHVWDDLENTSRISYFDNSNVKIIFGVIDKKSDSEIGNLTNVIDNFLKESLS